MSTPSWPIGRANSVWRVGQRQIERRQQRQHFSAVSVPQFSATNHNPFRHRVSRALTHNPTVNRTHATPTAAPND
jgi:hypothetical protein